MQQKVKACWQQVPFWVCLLSLVFLLPLTAGTFCAHMFEAPKVFLLRMALPVCFWFWLLQIRKQNYKIALDRRVASFIILVSVYWGLNLLSTCFSIDPSRSFFGTYDRQNGFWTTSCFVLLSLFILTLEIPTWIGPALCLVYMSSACIAAIIGFGQWHGMGWLPGWEIAKQFRPHGTFHFVNTFAGYLVISLILCWGYFFQTWRKTYFLLPLIVFLYVLFFATYCRGAWLSFITAISILLLIAGWIHGYQSFLKKTGFVILTIVFSYGVFVYCYPSVKPGASEDFKVFHNLTVHDRMTSGVKPSDVTATSRFVFWNVSLKIFALYPFLGSGPETLQFLYPEYRPLQEGEKIDFSSTVENAHNIFIHILATQGILSFLVWLSMIVLVFLSVFSKLWRSNHDPGLDYLTILACAWLGSILFQQLNPHSLSGNLFEWVAMSLLIRGGNNPAAEIKIIFISPRLQWISLPLLACWFCLALCMFSADIFLHAAWRAGAGDSNKSIPLLRKASVLGFGEPLYTEQTAQLYQKIQTKESLLEAWKLFTILAEKHPQDGKYVWGKVQTAWALAQMQGEQWLKKAKEEMKVLDRYIDTFPEKEMLCARLYIMEKEYETGLLYAKKAVQLQPSNVSYTHFLATAYQEAGRYAEAEETYRKALVLDPNHVESIHNLAILYWQTNRIEDSIREMKRTILLAPNYRNGYLSLARMYKNLNRKSELQSLLFTLPASLKDDPQFKEFL